MAVSVGFLVRRATCKVVVGKGFSTRRIPLSRGWRDAGQVPFVDGRSKETERSLRHPMPQYEVEKVVAVCLLEATKLVLQQLGRYRMELAEGSVEPPENLAATYGTVRRLRDYFQRSIGAYPDRVKLELDDGDPDTVVSCAARSIEVIDHELLTTRLSAQDKDWLQQKRSILIDWGVALATRPMADLPGPKPGRAGQGISSLRSGIAGKLKLHPDYGTLEGGDGGGDAAGGGIQHGFGTPFNRSGSAAPARSTGDTAVPSLPGVDAKPENVPIGVGFASMNDPVAVESRIIDPRAIRDPRLRPLMAMDLKAFERAIDARDHRLALVHLGSVLEGAVLDYCLPRRSEFGLDSAPETWDMRALIEKHVGLEAHPKSRGLLYQLVAAKNLIRPAAQMSSPMVVTANSLEQSLDLVRLVLKQMGFASGRVASSGRVPPAPPPSR